MTTTIAPFPTGLIRPWYPGHVPVGSVGGQFEAHLFPDCERLLKVRAQPVEGCGWLDPRNGPICEPCVEAFDDQLWDELFGGWDAVCSTCDTSMSEDHSADDEPATEAAARAWALSHECMPSTRVIAPEKSKKPVGATR